jgi:hypothetical protein
LNELDLVKGLFVFIYHSLIHCIFSMDSDLEAFSHDPTHGSFAALAVQLTAFTNYVIHRFLSY